MHLRKGVHQRDYTPAWNTSEDACIKGFTDKSAIAEHAWTEDHPILWDDTRILQHASQTMELVVKEAICIRTTPENSHFNRDGGLRHTRLLDHHVREA